MILLLNCGCGRSSLQSGEHDSGTEPRVDAKDAASGDDGRNNDSGDLESIVEYRGCSYDGAISRIWIYRIDRTNSTCTLVEITESFPSLCGRFGLYSSDGWSCVSEASINGDVSDCEEMGGLADAVQANSAKGTFTIGSWFMVGIDIELEFPPSGGNLPENIQMRANCEAKCEAEDCLR
jgi:hypothetical protein